MKEITSITSEGIHYLDEEGNPLFIDFETCLQNYMTRWQRPDVTDEDRVFWRSRKYVGVRGTFREPPALEFYTEPRIYFEFPTRESLDQVLVGIKKAGWRTNDGD